MSHRFRPFKDGIPSQDQLGDIFAVKDARQSQTCLVAGVAGLTGSGPEIIAIDGNTLRRAWREGAAKAPIHMVSA